MPPRGTVENRLIELERQAAHQERFLRQAAQRLGDAPLVRNPRHAITSATGTYPLRSQGWNTYEIIFTDDTFVEDFSGVKAITETLRQKADPKFLAHNLTNAPYVPEGKKLQVWRENSRWWFCYYDWDLLVCELQGALSAGGSVTVKWIIAKGGDGSTFTAHDQLGTFEGDAGDRAYVRWNHAAAQYWIENVQC